MTQTTLATLAALPSAAVLVADLPAVLGIPEADVPAVVDPLVAAGDLLSWPDHPDGPSVILSGEAAARLGLELVEVFRRDSDTPTFRWLPPTARAARRDDRKARRAVPKLESELRDKHGHGGFDDLVDDVAADPLRDAYPDERPGPHVDVRPRLLLGLSWAWPIAPTHDGSCRVCSHLDRLESYALCLHCLRSGSDAALAAVSAAERPRPATPALHDDGLQGGRGHARPKRAKPAPKRAKPAPKRAKPATGRRTPRKAS